MTSLYWDDFERRASETVTLLSQGLTPPVRRVAVFVTERCNFRCAYCNHNHSPRTMTRETFENIVHRYGRSAIVHITGGEPSCVPWLYEYLKAEGHTFRFHLNTNAYIVPPAESVQRLKVSLDSPDAKAWESTVGVSGAWKRVCDNIRDASEKTITSVTYTLSRDNYKDAPRFAEFAAEQFPSLYATFFSIYKGVDPRFAWTPETADDFFNNVRPHLLDALDDESRGLLTETLDEKRRLMQGVRFTQSLDTPCYLSMSERVFAPDGTESCCSHLYRDGICSTVPTKVAKCEYGCNQRLVTFNEVVHDALRAVR